MLLNCDFGAKLFPFGDLYFGVQLFIVATGIGVFPDKNKMSARRKLRKEGKTTVKREKEKKKERKEGRKKERKYKKKVNKKSFQVISIKILEILVILFV